MKNKFYGLVYKITNTINNKVYIGQTKQTLNRRKSQHKYHASLSKPKFVISRAIKKYGIDSFIFEILDYAKSNQELNIMEGKYIQLFKSYDKNFGYNVEKLSDNNKIYVSQETRNKLKITSSKPEYIQRMSELGKSSRCKKLPNIKTTSQFIGLEKCSSRWRVRVNMKNIKINLGLFITEIEAAQARDIVSLYILGHEALLNFPDLKHKYLSGEIHPIGTKGLKFDLSHLN